MRPAWCPSRCATHTASATQHTPGPYCRLTAADSEAKRSGYCSEQERSIAQKSPAERRLQYGHGHGPRQSLSPARPPAPPTTPSTLPALFPRQQYGIQAHERAPELAAPAEHGHESRLMVSMEEEFGEDQMFEMLQHAPQVTPPPILFFWFSPWHSCEALKFACFRVSRVSSSLQIVLGVPVCSSLFARPCLLVGRA